MDLVNKIVDFFKQICGFSNKIVDLFDKFVAFISNKIVDLLIKLWTFYLREGVLPHLENPLAMGLSACIPSLNFFIKNMK